MKSRLHIDGFLCVYCGEEANTKEHYPPKSFCKWGVIAPSCDHCNKTAKHFHPFNIERRILFIKSQIRKKFNKALNMPDWTQQEIEQLDWKLRTIILTGLEDKRCAQRRLSWDSSFFVNEYKEYLKKHDLPADYEE